jgi:hypothetical protein
MSTTDQFFSQGNEAMLERVLYNDIRRRTGEELSERQAGRLIKTVRHYMGEVYRVQGPGKNINDLNREVLVTTLPDFIQYLQRQQRSSNRSVVSDIEAGPGPTPGQAQSQQQVTARIEDINIKRTQLDVSTAFSELQASRQEKKATVPQPPDFRLSLKDEGPVSMDTFEQIRKQREEEAARADLLSRQGQTASQGQQNYAAAGSAFAADQRRQQEEAEAIFADRERERLMARASSAPLPEPPDMRGLILGDRAPGLGRTFGNTNAGNPTLAQAIADREPAGGLQQNIIVREPSTMTYQETELNLVIYSGDRDWTVNNRETRYNFSVNFDPSNLPTGLRMNPTSTVKFRNITRIEFVKAILPGENLEQMLQKTAVIDPDTGVITYGYKAGYTLTALQFPYIQVRVPELETNSYGTNQGLNAAFATLQFDANWIGEVAQDGYYTPLTRGYLAMIPKFMKCQKVYTPTPLSTLQKLSFNFQRPDGTALSTLPDTVDIADIITSKTNASTSTSTWPYGYDSTQESNTSAAYYTIRTSTFFNQYAFVFGERIVFKNLTFSTAPTTGTNATAQLADFLNWLQRDEGHIIMAVGYSTNSTSTQANFRVSNNAANPVGFCNLIVIRGKFADPTTGSDDTVSFAGLQDTSTNGGNQAGSLTAFLDGTTITAGKILNVNRQIQITMRVIVREMDATSVLRPDNL